MSKRAQEIEVAAVQPQQHELKLDLKELLAKMLELEQRVAALEAHSHGKEHTIGQDVIAQIAAYSAEQALVKLAERLQPAAPALEPQAHAHAVAE